MDKKICIAIDAMSGEDSPFKNIEGINLFCQRNAKSPMLYVLSCAFAHYERTVAAFPFVPPQVPACSREPVAASDSLR